MSATFVKVSAVVKFFDQSKGFGFVVTPQGDAFISARIAGDKSAQLVKGASVIIDFVKRYADGRYKLEATSLVSVAAPAPKPKPIEVLDTVIWFDPGKGFGFVRCGGIGLSRDQAHIHVSVAEKAGIIPGKGMPIRARVVEEKKGPKVISFEWGEAVEAAYAAKLGELHSEDGADVDVLMAEHAAETQAAIGQAPPAEAASEEAPAKPKRTRKPKAAKVDEKPDEGSVDIVAMAAQHCLNGGGNAIAQALAEQGGLTH